MAYYLGIDTSNYTTSAAVYDSASKKVTQQNKLLPVKDGALGLRQSDAVFSHVKQLGEVVETLMDSSDISTFTAVGVSDRPRDAEGSYMPCFLAGEMAARTAASIGGLPLFCFSHQAGHIAAALYSAGRLDLLKKRFIAFHFSGGTTECLLVEPDSVRAFSVTLLSQSLDLKAGQAVDRVGGMLGLPFPAGPHLEALALASQQSYRVRPSKVDGGYSLSGVENRCRKMLADGESSEDTARFCIDSVLSLVDAMTADVAEAYPTLPLIYSGGVMSNSIIRNAIFKKYGGHFAAPQFSSDNAAGIALLAQFAVEGGDSDV